MHARKLWHLHLDACLGPGGALAATTDQPMSLRAIAAHAGLAPLGPGNVLPTGRYTSDFEIGAAEGQVTYFLLAVPLLWPMHSHRSLHSHRPMHSHRPFHSHRRRCSV